MALRNLDLTDVATFVQVVDSGGISAAARVLHAPKSSVSRRLTRLEQRLGTQLAHRTTRSLTLTDAGRAFHARASAALAAIDDAASAAFDAREVPRGTVRLTAPPDIGAEVLPALLTAFLRAHPQVRLDVDFSPDPPSPPDGGHDLSVHVGRPADRTLTATKLQDMTFRVYAAPAYLARAGTPRTGADLAGHDCVLFRAQHGRARWRLTRRAAGPDATPDDALVDVVVQGPVTANDISFVRRAAIAGAGLALLPRLVGDAAVTAGHLRAVLPDHETASLPLYLAHPSSAHVPLAVRALRDHLLRHFPR